MGTSEEQLARFKDCVFSELEKDRLGNRTVIELQEIVANLNEKKQSIFKMLKFLRQILSANNVKYVNLAGNGNYPNYSSPLGRSKILYDGGLREGDQILSVGRGKIIISMVKIRKKGFFWKEKKYLSFVEKILISPSMKFSLVGTSASYADQSGYTLNIR